MQGHAHEVFTDAGGKPLVEIYTIAGMGHGTPVDPGPGPEQCGRAGAFILDAGICSSLQIARFWGLGQPPDGGNGNGTPVPVTAQSCSNVWTTCNRPSMTCET